MSVMESSAHTDFKQVVKGLFDDQLDHDNADDPDDVELDFNKIKVIHKAFPYDVDKWQVTSQNAVVTSSDGGTAETEVYFKAYTDMAQSFIMPMKPEYMNVSVEIPEKFRIPMTGSATGQSGAYPKQIVIPHIGEGKDEKTSRCPNCNPDGKPVKFQEMTVKGEIVIYTSFQGNVKITTDGEPQEVSLELILDKAGLLEESRTSGTKNFVSRGLIKMYIKKQVV